MGTWGPAIFSDDLASDVRGDFRDLVAEGMSPQEATARLAAEYEPEKDPSVGDVFWLALAASQWQLGRLEDEVRQRAMRVIAEGSDLRRWEAEARPADVKKRRAALTQLEARLQQPPPAPRPVRPRYVEETEFEVGDVVRYRMASGQPVLLRVIYHHVDKGGRAPEVEVLDWTDESLPSREELAHLPARRHRMPPGTPPELGLTVNALFRWSKTDYPAERLEVVARGIPIKPMPKAVAVGILWWKRLDEVLREDYGFS